MRRKIKFRDAIKVSDQAVEEIVAWLQGFNETEDHRTEEADP